MNKQREGLINNLLKTIGKKLVIEDLNNTNSDRVIISGIISIKDYTSEEELNEIKIKTKFNWYNSDIVSNGIRIIKWKQIKYINEQVILRSEDLC